MVLPLGVTHYRLPCGVQSARTHDAERAIWFGWHVKMRFGACAILRAVADVMVDALLVLRHLADVGDALGHDYSCGLPALSGEADQHVFGEGAGERDDKLVPAVLVLILRP